MSRKSFSVRFVTRILEAKSPWASTSASMRRWKTKWRLKLSVQRRHLWLPSRKSFNASFVAKQHSEAKYLSTSTNASILRSKAKWCPSRTVQRKHFSVHSAQKVSYRRASWSNTWEVIQTQNLCVIFAQKLLSSGGACSSIGVLTLGNANWILLIIDYWTISSSLY